MNDSLEQLATACIPLALAVGIVVSILRALIEIWYPGIKDKDWYTKVALPTLAILLGLGAALLTHQGWQSGLIAGFASSYVFRMAKMLLVKKAECEPT